MSVVCHDALAVCKCYYSQTMEGKHGNGGTSEVSLDYLTMTLQT